MMMMWMNELDQSEYNRVHYRVQRYQYVGLRMDPSIAVVVLLRHADAAAAQYGTSITKC